MLKTILRAIAAPALLLALPALIFAGGSQAKQSAAGEIKVLAAISGGKDDAENELFQEALSKALGVKVIWEKPASYDQALMQKLGAGEAYDLIYLGQTQMYTFVQQGILTDLTSRLNNSAVIKANYPAGELDKIAINGRYYAGFNKLEVFTLPNVNKAVTDKAGIDLSKLATLDDYYNMLKAVKNYKENTEGVKPYYPFYIYMPDIWDLQPWFSSLGLRRGVYKDAGGKKYAPYVTPQAAPVWEWLAKLYQEGLIDPTSFTGRTSDMRNKMWQSQEIVMDVDWVAWTGLYNNNAKVAGDYPAKVNVVGLSGTRGPSGKYFLEQGGASLWGVPVNAKNPDGGFKIIEYFATKEGGLLLSAGIEGHDYALQGGRAALTETGISHSRDHGAPFPISTQFDFAILGDLNPGVMESYAIGKRNDVAVEPMGYNNGDLDTRQFYDIVSKWMTDCMMGRLKAAEALNSAAEELRSRKIID
ncbi:MAG: extracellular solute-binding protein [Treponema sp.]|jgi:putative aldouronate transport system substrate-binding protein|nr:extracellular solute-binding protein [Treponema sp.]